MSLKTPFSHVGVVIKPSNTHALFPTQTKFFKGSCLAKVLGFLFGFWWLRFFTKLKAVADVSIAQAFFF